MRRNLVFIIFIFVFVLFACGEQPKPTLTMTLGSTFTPQPTVTFTLVSTHTPSPADTPKPTHAPTSTPVPPVELGKAQSIKAGGFSFQPPDDFIIQLYAIYATMSDMATSSITIDIGIIARAPSETLEDAMGAFLDTIAQDIHGLEANKPYSITVDNAPGLSMDISGTWREYKGSGQVLAVVVDETRFLFALGFAADGPDGKGWENQGHKNLAAVLDSVKFFEPLSGTCVISQDSTYGYTKENPIRVGESQLTNPPQGALFMDARRGPSRERAYLDALRGPNGEEIAYDRSGSTGGSGVILDAYEITCSGLDEPITLYIDMYHYVEPQAPVGFICAYPFPLSEP